MYVAKRQFNDLPFVFQIADNFDMPFFEVSCKQNVNIEEAFVTLARKIREQREHRVSQQCIICKWQEKLTLNFCFSG